MNDATPKSDVQAWLTSLFMDPIVITLLKSSHLTKIQLETFLIDILAEKISGKPVIYDRKAKLRLMKSGVSRGAFNRTLAQARRNTIRSIYTLILLGYLGVFDSPRLEPYVEIADKIRNYTEAYKGVWRAKRTSNEHLRILNMLQKEIERGLKGLSSAKALSTRT